MHKTRYLCLVLQLALLPWLAAQYAPAAGEMGSTAIPASSPLFIGWASDCQLLRGPQDISDTALGPTTVGTPASAIGPADGGTVSLGDGGVATLAFEHPLRNGPGWDFAVFENGFASGNGFFLELALVEVSSDGEHFVRFPAASLTDTLSPLGSFGLIDPTQINNLAGKYVLHFGTPFDLAELAGAEGLDIDRITHLRLIDVVGSLAPQWRSLDAAGRPINDPWPTPFPSSGFDLDAVGVIHDARTVSTESPAGLHPQALLAYPNPASAGQRVSVRRPSSGVGEEAILQIVDPQGRPVGSYYYGRGAEALSFSLPLPGCYWLRWQQASGSVTAKLIIR